MLSPDVKILCSLGGGSVPHKAFRTLKLTTGLSATWLSKKLKEMMSAGLITMDGRFYTLTQEGKEKFRGIDGYAYPLFLLEKAHLFSKKISEVPVVEGVILFGSLAQGRGGVNSDLDLLIVIHDGAYTKGLENALKELAYEYEIPGELFIVEEASVKAHMEGESLLSLAFGVLEGYQVLLDKHSRISVLLNEAKKRVGERYEYIEDARIWLKKSQA